MPAKNVENFVEKMWKTSNLCGKLKKTVENYVENFFLKIENTEYEITLPHGVSCEVNLNTGSTHY